MNIKKKLRAILLTAFTFLFMLFLLLYAKATSCGALNGIKLCAEIIVPSLFPFMVLASFVVKSGIADKIGRYFAPLTKFLFRLPGCTGSAIIISMAGGYPTGAKTIQSLYEKKLISKLQAKRMALFCVCPGPGFAITAVGSEMLNDMKSGIILFASQIFSLLITGVLLSFFAGKETADVRVQEEKAAAADDFIDSVSSSVNSVINMCGLIILFSCIISIAGENGFMNFLIVMAEKMGINPTAAASLPICILEVTSGCQIACVNHVPLEFISFALGFSGLCIHFQLFSILKFGISKIKFLIVRLFSALTASLNTYTLLRFFPVEKQVFFSNTQKIVFHSSQSYTGFICLVFMCIVFMISVRKLKIQKSSKNV